MFESAQETGFKSNYPYVHLLCLYNPLYKVKQIWCEDSVNLHVLPKFSKLFHYKDLENKVKVTKTKCVDNTFP